MGYSLIPILLLAAAAMVFYRMWGDRKRECQRLQKELAAKDEIERLQIEVIEKLSKEVADLEQEVEDLEVNWNIPPRDGYY